MTDSSSHAVSRCFPGNHGVGVRSCVLKRGYFLSPRRLSTTIMLQLLT